MLEDSWNWTRVQSADDVGEGRIGCCCEEVSTYLHLAGQYARGVSTLRESVLRV